MIDLTTTPKAICQEELLLTLEELQYDLESTEDEFEQYEIEENIEIIKSLLKENTNG